MADTASSGERLFRSIVAAKPKLVTGVPDGMLAQTIMACERTKDFPYIACAREEECIGVASGAAMAGERAIVRLEMNERVVGLYDSPPVDDGRDLLFETSVWIGQDNSTVPFVFTFVNGNPFGGAVDETVDYYPSCWQRHHDAKSKHFPEQMGKSGDAWMPKEPEGLDIRWIEDIHLEISGPHYDAWPPVGFQREFAAAMKSMTVWFSVFTEAKPSVSRLEPDSRIESPKPMPLTPRMSSP